MVCLCIC